MRERKMGEREKREGKGERVLLFSCEENVLMMNNDVQSLISLIIMAGIFRYDSDEEKRMIFGSLNHK